MAEERKRKVADIWPEKMINYLPVKIWVRGDGTGLVRVRYRHVLEGRRVNLGGITVTLRKRCHGVWGADISRGSVEFLRRKWLMEGET